jgi:hypothetical protein
VSPNKTLYIRDQDMPAWERAESAARRRGISLSQLVAQALERAVPPPPADLPYEEIRVNTGENYQRTEAFTGFWLVEPDDHETRTSQKGYDPEAYWGVALTKRGQIAVWTAHCLHGFPGTLDVYASLDDAPLPEDIKADAANELGQEHVIYRDI